MYGVGCSTGKTEIKLLYTVHASVNCHWVKKACIFWMHWRALQIAGNIICVGVNTLALLTFSPPRINSFATFAVPRTLRSKVGNKLTREEQRIAIAWCCHDYRGMKAYCIDSLYEAAAAAILLLTGVMWCARMYIISTDIELLDLYVLTCTLCSALCVDLGLLASLVFL